MPGRFSGLAEIEPQSKFSGLAELEPERPAERLKTIAARFESPAAIANTLTDQDRTALNKAMSHVDTTGDIQEKLAVSWYLARQLDVKPDWVFKNYPEVTQNFFGRQVTPKEGFREVQGSVTFPEGKRLFRKVAKGVEPPKETETGTIHGIIQSGNMAWLQMQQSGDVVTAFDTLRVNESAYITDNYISALRTAEGREEPGESRVALRAFEKTQRIEQQLRDFNIAKDVIKDDTGTATPEEKAQAREQVIQILQDPDNIIGTARIEALKDPAFIDLLKDISARELEIGTIQLSPAMNEFNRSEGREAFVAFSHNPFEITANLAVSGGISSIKPIGLSIIGGLGGGIPGAIAGGAAGTFETEYAARFLMGFNDAGVNVGNPDELIAAFSDSEKMIEIQAAASARGLTITAFEIITGGLMSKLRILRPGVKGAKAINIGARLTLESIGEGAGEAAGSYAAGDKITVKDVFSEMIGGFGLSSTQVAINEVLQSGEEKRVVYGRSGGLMTESDIKQIKDDLTAEQIPQAMKKVENGKLLEKAINGDQKALDAYNETLLEDIAKNQSSAGKPLTIAATYEREGNILRVTEDGLYFLTTEDGATISLDPNSEKQKQLISEITGLAVDDISPVPGIQSEVDAYVRQYGSDNIQIVIVDKSPDVQGVKGKINAQFDRDTGVVTLFADQISPNQVAGLLRHEHFVHGMLKTIIGEEQFEKLLVSIEKAMPEELAEIRERYKNVYGADRAKYAEEVIAHLVENENNLSPVARGMVDRLIKQIREFLRRFVDINYSRDEIKGILQNAYGKLRQRKGIQRDTNESLSSTPESRAVPKAEQLKNTEKQINEMDEAFIAKQDFNRLVREQSTKLVKERDIDVMTFQALDEKHFDNAASIKEINKRADKEPDLQFSISENVQFSITPAQWQITKLNIQRGINAFNDVIRSKRSVRNVMIRKEIGSIDFDYGKPGDVKNSFEGGEGISHIIGKIFFVEQREPVSSIQRMIATIATGKLMGLKKRVGGKAIFQMEESVVTLTRKKDKAGKRWVISDFKDKPPQVNKRPYRATLINEFDDPMGAVSLYLKVEFPTNMVNRMDPRNENVQFSISDDSRGLFNDLLNESVNERRLELQRNGVEMPPETRLQLFVRKIQNRINRLEQLVGIVGEKKDIEPHNNPALQAELMIGKATQRIDEFIKEIYDETSDSLLVRVRKAGFSLDDFGDYMHAKHAAERNDHVRTINPNFVDGGSGLTYAQAQEILDKFADTNIHEFAAEFYEKVTKARLTVMLDAGLITEEDFEKLGTFYDFYVPLKRELDVQEGFGRRRTQIDPNIEKTLGSQKRVRNPVVSAIAEMEDSIIQAEKNKSYQVLLKFLGDNPDDAWQITPFEAENTDPNEEGNFFDQKELMVPSDYVLKVLVNGKAKYIKFTDMALVSGIRGLGAEKGIRILQAANAYLRGVFVTYNPEFLVTNFMRDIQTALIHITGEKSLVMAAKVIKDLPSAMLGIWRDVRGKDVTEWTFLYQDLKRQGGKVGWFDFKSFADKKRELESKIARTEQKALNPFKTTRILAKFINNLNEAVESGVRLAVYKNLIDAGDSPAVAASFSKNVTVNFNKKGEWGEMMNSFFLFSNASIQGSTRILQSLRSSRKTQALVTGIVLAGFLNRFLLRAMDDEDKEYDKLNDWTRENNWIIPLGGGEYLKYRVPYGYNVFKAIGDATADVFLREKTPGQASGRILSVMNSSFNPLGEDVFTPTVGDPIQQIRRNQNFFGGKIRPDQPQFQAFMPDSQLYFKSSRKTTVAVVEKLNELSGGSETVSGFIDINPENIDHLVDFLGGGSLKFANNTFETAISAINGEMPELRNIPFVRQIVGTIDDRAELPTIYEMRNNSLRKIYDEGDARKFNKYVGDAVRKRSITSKTASKYRKEFYRNQLKARISLEKAKQ